MGILSKLVDKEIAWEKNAPKRREKQLKKRNAKLEQMSIEQVRSKSKSVSVKDTIGTSSPKSILKTSTPVSVETKKSTPSSETLTFKQAFAQARKAGLKVFTWNGKKYHTRTKEEEEEKRGKQNSTTRKSTSISSKGKQQMTNEPKYPGMTSKSHKHFED